MAQCVQRRVTAALSCAALRSLARLRAQAPVQALAVAHDRLLQPRCGVRQRLLEPEVVHRLLQAPFHTDTHNLQRKF